MFSVETLVINIVLIYNSNAGPGSGANSAHVSWTYETLIWAQSVLLQTKMLDSFLKLRNRWEI